MYLVVGEEFVWNLKSFKRKHKKNVNTVEVFVKTNTTMFFKLQRLVFKKG